MYILALQTKSSVSCVALVKVFEVKLLKSSVFTLKNFSSFIEANSGPNIKWCKVIEQNIIWEWTEHYVSYKRLKKIIKKLQDLLVSGVPNKALFAELQHKFDALVHKVLYLFFIILVRSPRTQIVRI